MKLMMAVVEKLLSACLCAEEEDLDFDELVRRAIEIIKTVRK